MKVFKRIFAGAGIAFALMAVPSLPAQAPAPHAGCTVERVFASGQIICWYFCPDGTTYYQNCPVQTK